MPVKASECGGGKAVSHRAQRELLVQLEGGNTGDVFVFLF